MAGPRPLRVLHLVGSPTSDFHDRLSRLYARDALAATADPDRYEPVVAHVGPDRRWRFPAVDHGDPGSSLSQETVLAAPAMDAAAAVARLGAVGADVAVPQMFCLAGMTHYRALLDLLGVPYVGNSPAVMALAADKVRARAVVAAAGVAVPEAVVVPRGARPEVGPLPAGPVVVKPVDADNSDGLSLVHDPSRPGALDAALDAAWAHSSRALVERYVELGREVRCGVVERAGRLVALPIEEYAVDAVDKPVRDGADKLARDEAGELRLVAKDAAHAWIVDAHDPVVPAVHEAALAAYAAMGCRHYGLFDFRVDPAGGVWFLEAGPYCSYAAGSVIVVMARAAGITLPELFADGAALALADRDQEES